MNTRKRTEQSKPIQQNTERLGPRSLSATLVGKITFVSIFVSLIGSQLPSSLEIMLKNPQFKSPQYHLATTWAIRPLSRFGRYPSHQLPVSEVPCRRCSGSFLEALFFTVNPCCTSLFGSLDENFGSLLVEEISMLMVHPTRDGGAGDLHLFLQFICNTGRRSHHANEVLDRLAPAIAI